jgi:8-oxo-dGTP diphosphatase/2-hydroxy-dATP diphosphatase
MKIPMTLVMIYDEEKILLAMKKRGFGTGRWNGYGGKVDESESIEQSARRELLEESGISEEQLADLKFVNRGQITFSFEDSGSQLEVHLFSVDGFSGEVQETEEMKPQWFAHKDIPYSEMWADDPHWLPLLLQGKNIRAEFTFDNKDDQNILSKSIETYE